MNIAIAENILKSNFKVKEPDTVYSTDVTYLILKNQQRYYLSVVKDIASGEIVAHKVSKNHNIDLILDALSQLKPIDKCILHSDRGALYTSF